MAKALKMASVGPVMVTILSGQFPSEMLILAPLWKEVSTPGPGLEPRAVPGWVLQVLTATGKPPH